MITLHADLIKMGFVYLEYPTQRYQSQPAIEKILTTTYHTFVRLLPTDDWLTFDVEIVQNADGKIHCVAPPKQTVGLLDIKHLCKALGVPVNA